jgi:hypothetical protein
VSQDIEIIKSAIELNRQKMVESLLAHLGVEEINEAIFQELIDIVEDADVERLKYLKALESQQVVEHFLKDKLV